MEILNCIPSTEDWIQAFNKPDKWDNRLLIQECLVQRKTGMLLAPILLNKFKANLFHRGNLIMNPNRTIEETMDSALHMLFTNALSEDAELYDYRRLKLILTSIVKERKDYSFKARHALMCLKNNKQQTVYDILLQHSDRINKSSYRDQCYTLLRDWCTKEKFNAIFHTNIYTACKPHYKQQVLHA